MAYCTQANIEGSYPSIDLKEVTDDNQTGAINASIVTQAIADADAFVDLYLYGRYTVPLTTVPIAIRRISVDQAMFYLLKRRAFDITGTMELTLKQNEKILKSIQEGKTPLGIETGIIETGGMINSNKTSTDKVFTSTLLDTF